MGQRALVKYQAGDIILRQGEVSLHLYKILTGSASLYLNYGQTNQYLIGILKPQEHFGELALLNEQPTAYTVVARDAMAVLAIPKDMIPSYLQESSQRTVSILETMNRQIAFFHTFFHETSKYNPEDAQTVYQSTAEHLNLKEPEPPAPPVTPPQPDTPHSEFCKLYLSGHHKYPYTIHPEYKTYLFEKHYTCPNCQKKFDGVHTFYSQLTTAYKPDHMRYDLTIFYRDYEVEWYELLTCPHCMFTTIDNVFSDSKFDQREYYEKSLLRGFFEPSLEEAKSQIPLDLNAERDLNFVFAQHYLALSCVRAYKDYRQISAHIWSNLAWLYRRYGDEELGQLAENRACELYIDAYMNCRMTPKQEQVTCLRIANMFYRAGDKHAARRWANNVRTNPDTRSSVYANLAKQLIDDIKDELEEEAAAKAAAEAAAAAAAAAAQPPKEEKNSRIFTAWGWKNR